MSVALVTRNVSPVTAKEDQDKVVLVINIIAKGVIHIVHYYKMEHDPFCQYNA